MTSTFVQNSGDVEPRRARPCWLYVTTVPLWSRRCMGKLIKATLAHGGAVDEGELEPDPSRYQPFEM